MLKTNSAQGCNSDSNIKNIDYPIVANDTGVPSIKFFVTAIGEAYKKGQMSATADKSTPADKSIFEKKS